MNYPVSLSGCWLLASLQIPNCSSCSSSSLHNLPIDYACSVHNQHEVHGDQITLAADLALLPCCQLQQNNTGVGIGTSMCCSAQSL